MFRPIDFVYDFGMEYGEQERSALINAIASHINRNRSNATYSREIPSWLQPHYSQPAKEIETAYIGFSTISPNVLNKVQNVGRRLALGWEVNLENIEEYAKEYKIGSLGGIKRIFKSLFSRSEKAIETAEKTAKTTSALREFAELMKAGVQKFGGGLVVGRVAAAIAAIMIGRSILMKISNVISGDNKEHIPHRNEGYYSMESIRNGYNGVRRNTYTPFGSRFNGMKNVAMGMEYMYMNREMSSRTNIPVNAMDNKSFIKPTIRQANILSSQLVSMRPNKGHMMTSSYHAKMYFRRAITNGGV
ncbi:MAG TPA: hypothetical protein ENF25_03105 [Thermoprotei archaeon]|nr:hypothetical protein [Thermoprotei archaeon]